MEFHEDPIVIVGSSCRLPGGVRRTCQVWDALTSGKELLSPAPPASRSSIQRPLSDAETTGKAGWIDDNDILAFDPSFFSITSAEASTLRPSTRLALELTWEALEVAGIPPSTLRGKTVSVTIGIGTEDGWDQKRYSDDDEDAFNTHWGVNSDPSEVSGHVSHFFDFRGPTSVVSAACSSAAFALREGILSILNGDCDIAIVGGITTHFFPAPFRGATAVNAASRKGQSASFSKAEGYPPSEGAVFFVSRRLSDAKRAQCPILGIVRSIAAGHSGSTRALATPTVEGLEAVCRKALSLAGLCPSDVTILEAHGTGTRLGDAIELEAVRKVFGDNSGENTLWLSSSKTVFGHCQAASAFVGILKVLSSFQHRELPSHGVEPLPELLYGKIQIPVVQQNLEGSSPIVALINSFGVTGSVASIVLEEPPKQDFIESAAPTIRAQYPLPFSARTIESLTLFIRDVCIWAIRTGCNLYDLGAILSLSRDHHAVRRCVILSDTSELALLRDDPLQYRSRASSQVPEYSLPHVENQLRSTGHISRENRTLQAKYEIPSKASTSEVSPRPSMEVLYELGHDIHFGALYSTDTPRYKEHLQTFPTYPFSRKICWKGDRGHHTSTEHSPEKSLMLQSTSNIPVNQQSITEIIAKILSVPPINIPYDASIFDLGINSIHSIELSHTLSRSFGSPITVTDLYSLLTVDAITSYFSSRSHDMITQGLNQSDVDRLVQIYGAPVGVSSFSGENLKNEDGRRVVLLTGGNGKLGCHVLNRLLLDPSIMFIFCLVRGEAWDRLSSAYSQHGYDLGLLSESNATGRLRVYKTKGLDDELLGCSREEYECLLRSVDTIIHAAWRLNFNLPVGSFEDCFSGTRNLAELSIHATKKVSYFFLSSYSSYFGYGNRLLPEEPLSPVLAYSLDQGYAISKLVAEHALITLHGHHPTLFHLRIVRIGQICGNSVTGVWTKDEMVPMIIKSAPLLNAVPRNQPDVSWIPSDVCADVIHDILSRPIPDALKVLHIANPDIVPWKEVVGTISSLLKYPNFHLLSDAEYVGSVEKAAESVPIRRLLPFLLHVVNHGGFPDGYCSLDVQETLKLSKSLRLCPKIDTQFLSPIVAFLVGDDLPRRLYAPQAPVLLFGPWSDKSDPGSTQLRASPKIKTLLQGLVSVTRSSIGYLQPDHSLERQIESLAIQLSTVEQLVHEGMEPVSVLGYCFGEYAAAIVAGILSESDVVEILVRRSAALKEVSGSMLNVFEEETNVKRLLLRLTAPPDLAIFAGPRHIVLSGTTIQINAAHELLRAQGINCRLVPTSIPFHSSVMDGVIKKLELPPIYPKQSKCVYVSGLLGGPVSGNNLGRSYWLRHMRDPVRFYSAMQYLRGELSIHPPLNCGPGLDLVSEVTRYEWYDVSFLGTMAVVPSGTDEQIDLQTSS